jgi:hypothetical protein
MGHVQSVLEIGYSARLLVRSHYAVCMVTSARVCWTC